MHEVKVFLRGNLSRIWIAQKKIDNIQGGSDIDAISYKSDIHSFLHKWSKCMKQLSSGCFDKSTNLYVVGYNLLFRIMYWMRGNCLYDGVTSTLYKQTFLSETISSYTSRHWQDNTSIVVVPKLHHFHSSCVVSSADVTLSLCSLLEERRNFWLSQRFHFTDFNLSQTRYHFPNFINLLLLW